MTHTGLEMYPGAFQLNELSCHIFASEVAQICAYIQDRSILGRMYNLQSSTA